MGSDDTRADPPPPTSAADGSHEDVAAGIPATNGPAPERVARPERPARPDRPARPERAARAAATVPAGPPVSLSAALIDEAMRKAAVAWVAVPGRQPVGLWCLPREDQEAPPPRGRLYVVSGPGEQAAPGLDRAPTATATLRGDHGGRILTWPAEVRRVEPGSAEWDVVAPLLAGKRLNAPLPAEALIARWAAECMVHCLAPAGEPVEAGATLPDSTQAEPVRDARPVRPTRRPFRLHRVRRRD